MPYPGSLSRTALRFRKVALIRSLFLQLATMGSLALVAGFCTQAQAQEALQPPVVLMDSPICTNAQSGRHCSPLTVYSTRGIEEIVLPPLRKRLTALEGAQKKDRDNANRRIDSLGAAINTQMVSHAINAVFTEGARAALAAQLEHRLLTDTDFRKRLAVLVAAALPDPKRQSR